MNNIIDTFINEYDRKYDFYLMEYNFKIVFNKTQYVVNIETNPRNSCITMSPGCLLNDAINDINNQRYTFDRID